MEMLGEKIKQLRSEMTQEELAGRLRVDRSTLASWEINRREPDIATLCRIASYFGVSIDWLVGYQPEGRAPGGSSVHEAAPAYQLTQFEWPKVISLANQHGLDDEMASKMIELGMKVTQLVHAQGTE